MADYSIYAELGLDSKGFEKGVKKAQSSLNGFSSGIKAVTKTLGSLFAIGSVAQFTKEIGKMASSFNDARAEIVKGTGATGQALEELSQSVTDALQKGVGLSAQEIGGMVADLNTRFGVMGDELTDLVDKFDMFSSVTGTDTRNAINSVADVMAKWGVETEQAGILLDQLTVASQESGASVEELEAGLKSGQAIFSQFGMSVTQSTAFLATLKKNGIDTGQALTGMRTALAKFSQEGRNAKTAFRETSESIKNAKTETEALQIATEIFGTRSGAEMVRVLRSGSMSADEMAKKLRTASGALKETDEASRTVKDAIDDLKARFTALFSGFSGNNTLRDMIDELGNAIGKINLDEVTQKLNTFISGFVAVASVISEVIKTIYNNFVSLFSQISEMLGNSENRFEVWKTSLFNTFDNLYRIVQDVFGLISAILRGDWQVAWEYTKLAVMRAVSVILDNISDVANMFPNLINTMIKGLNKLVDGINKVREFFGQPLLEHLGEFTSVDLVESTGLGQAIRNAEKKIEELTGKSADVQIKSLENVSTKRKEYVDEVVSGEIEIQGAIAQTVQAQEGGSQQLAEAMSSGMEGAEGEVGAVLAGIKKAFEGVKKFVQSVSKVVVKVVKETIKIIGKIFTGIKNLISLDPDTMLDNLLKVEDKILTFFVETLPKLPQFLASAFQSISVLIGSILDGVDFGNIFENLSNVVIEILKKLPKVIKKYFPKFLNALKVIFKEFNKITPVLLKTLEDVAGTVLSGMAEFIKEGLPAFLQTIISFLPTIMGLSSQFVKGIASILPTIVQSIFDAFIVILQDPKQIADLVVTLIRTFVEMIMVVVRNIGPLLEALLPAIGTIIIEVFKAIPSLLWELTTELGSAILDIAKWVVNKIIDGINTMLDGISSVWTWIPNTKPIPHIPHFANGTDNAPRGLALVGEAGPELVRFNGGEQVLNNRETNKALAGMSNSNTFNVNFYETKDTTAFAMISQLRQYNRQMAINSIV